jgi:putative mRNA 3-end processing factor
MPLLSFTNKGIYCEQGDFYIDPWKGVKKAVITHAHSDHARWGSQMYLAHKDTVPILKLRLGNIVTTSAEYGHSHLLNGVKVSFHPAGHVIGSAQVRVEYKGEIWVFSGDYKTEPDNVCEAFEPIKCHTFISETTFGLPVYKWDEQALVMNQINEWWKQNADAGIASVIFAYALGKAQRILQNIDHTIGPVFTHGAVENINEQYRQHGIIIKPTIRFTAVENKKDFSKSLIIVPPSAEGGAWMQRIGDFSSGIASGWMAIRGMRRRRAVNRGFVLSDHADWNGLNKAIEATDAEKIYLTHGYTSVFCRWLRENNKKAFEVKTGYGEEEQDIDVAKV